MTETVLKVGVTFKGALADALQQESDKTLAPYAAIVRAATERYLRERGYDVEDNVSWGGSRRRQKDAEEGQRVALAPA